MDPMLFDMRPERPGYRLQRLEMLNWGTFDCTQGQVYRFEPEGRTALLVGHNGSGKSTLVDAMLTLLVPSNIRNYNVAAGAKKTERSEKSYIRGAYGRSSDESQNPFVQYLRAKGGTFTAIAAVFRDEQQGRAFTVCQVLYLTADGTPDKVFAIVDEVRELTSDLSGVRSSDAIRGRLNECGYQSTKTFLEYHGWIVKRTQMRGKAMDMFNQTVAVKDIQSLNDFIRKHMLEAHDWRENVQRLLTHFNDLSVAHQELVRAQKAEELLTPVEKLGHKYREQEAKLDAFDRQLHAADAFFATEIVRLFTPEVARFEVELAATIDRKKRLGDELKSMGESVRKLKNEIEHVGGQRLRDIPVLIEREQAYLNTKKETYRRYHEQLRRCGIEDDVATPDGFYATRKRLHSLAEELATNVAATMAEHEVALAKRGALRDELRNEEHELEFLSKRQTNLPVHLATLRGQMCADLQLSESILPFVAELISVAPEERRWEASAEMVLRSFALSLLVPDRYYRRVRAYVEATRLADGRGVGQRLVYLRVGKAEETAPSGDRLHPQSMFRKLQFRTGQDLTPWVRDEVLRRFDFRCCESIDEFNDTARLAMTENRHVKFGNDRHEKDDRPRAADPRHYVLGWDNRQKLARIAARIHELQTELAILQSTISLQAESLELARGQESAVAASLEVADFDAIDVGRHQREVTALEREKSELESSNQAVKTLRKRLKQAEAEEFQLSKQRDEALKREQALADQIESGNRLIANSQRQIAAAKVQETYDASTSQFDFIQESLGQPALSILDVFEREKRWKDETQRRVEKLRKRIEPLGDDLVKAMNRYLREFKEEQADVDASVHALESFLGLLQQIRDEDLPRHEKKFKDRLNDKVTEEVAFFHRSLRSECKQIESKVEQLNVALAQLEYHPGTFMRLEPREVNDREIADFRRSLRECLDESLENTDEANEARFLRIKSLVERLGDKDNTRWRDKVIDVRHWFDFAAREVEKENGQTRSFYEDSAGQSGGEKAKLAFTILVAAIAYQYDLDPTGRTPGRFHFVMVDEMFSKVDDQNAEYALKLFEQFGLQLLIVAPLDSKARVTEPFVDCYLHVVKDETTHCSQLYSMSAREYDEVVASFSANGQSSQKRRVAAK
jgi:uncharacterized protein YPO0396